MPKAERKSPEKRPMRNGVDGASGRIFEIQRFSIHDGPGIRTTVFMKGCPLRCLWCHNPESTIPDSFLSFISKKCIHCGYCVNACPQEAHRFNGDEHLLDRDKCIVCGKCTRECYAGALEVVGRDACVEDVMEIILRDRPFYDNSGGGITLSGGEPTSQIDFCDALLTASKKEQLNTCVETCGSTPYTRLKRIAPLVDLFLYDIKETDSRRHKKYTGVGNELILDNLRRLHDSGAHVLLRCPIIPGLNDRDDHFEALARISSSLPRLQGIEIMPYHLLGSDKRERFGLAPGKIYDVPKKETVANWCRRLAEAGVCVVGG